MKKHFLTPIAVLIVSLTLFSCSKDEEETIPPFFFFEENYLAGFLTNSGFSEITDNSINGGDYEFGLDFTPLVKGKITSLKVKLPDVNNALRVTLWDKSTATPTVIRTETINVTTANTEQNLDIVDIELTANQQYAITMNSDDWYNHRRTENTATTYPITSGNIRIDNYKWIFSTTQIYPTNISTTYYAGDLSFNFLRTE